MNSWSPCCPLSSLRLRCCVVNNKSGSPEEHGCDVSRRQITVTSCTPFKDIHSIYCLPHNVLGTSVNKRQKLLPLHEIFNPIPWHVDLEMEIQQMNTLILVKVSNVIWYHNVLRKTNFIIYFLIYKNSWNNYFRVKEAWTIMVYLENIKFFSISGLNNSIY